MRIKYTLLLLSFLPVVFLPGCGKAITLEDAINRALNENLQVLIEQKKVEEAKMGMKEALAGYLPTLDLKGNYTHLDRVPSIKTPFGEEIPMGDQDTTSFTLSLTQPLYTSGQLVLATKQAKFNYQRTSEELQRTKNEIIYQVTQSFYSNLLAEQNVRIKEKALQRSKAHLEVVESFYKSGRASRLDFLRAKVEVANLEPDLIRAKNELNLARERLANLLSMSPSSLEVEGELKFEPLGLTLDKLIQKALLSRSDLKALKTQEDMAKVSVRMAKVRNLPSLSFVGNYEYAEAGDEWEGSWNINLALTFPLFNARNRAIVEERRSQQEQLTLAIKQLENAIKQEVRKAYWDMEAARESIYAQKQNIEQAEEALSIAEARYRSGMATQLEVLDAQLALTKARLGYTSALYEYNTAKAALMKAIGEVLHHEGGDNV